MAALSTDIELGKREFWTSIVVQMRFFKVKMEALDTAYKFNEHSLLFLNNQEDGSVWAELPGLISWSWFLVFPACSLIRNNIQTIIITPILTIITCDCKVVIKALQCRSIQEHEDTLRRLARERAEWEQQKKAEMQAFQAQQEEQVTSLFPVLGRCICSRNSYIWCCMHAWLALASSLVLMPFEGRTGVLCPITTFTDASVAPSGPCHSFPFYTLPIKVLPDVEFHRVVICHRASDIFSAVCGITVFTLSCLITDWEIEKGKETPRI